MNGIGVQFTLSQVGGGPSVNVTGSSLMRAPFILSQEIDQALTRVAKQMLMELERLYHRVSRAGFRDNGTPTLMTRLQQALRSEVISGGSGMITDIEMRAFNLDTIYRLTSNRELGEPTYPGWFALREDGSTGVSHGSNWYGFLSVEHATRLADELATEMNLSNNKLASLKQHIRDKMSGRHGEGIMTRLDWPVFFAYPEFGTAADHGVEPHAGFTAWNLYRGYVASPHAEGLIATAMRTAFDRAMRRVQQGGA